MVIENRMHIQSGIFVLRKPYAHYNILWDKDGNKISKICKAREEKIVKEKQEFTKLRWQIQRGILVIFWWRRVVSG